uniref:Uncharacterized protein n=1 Tax=Arundo donax TaxID=35708 RepID=A0A0A9GWF7_ARUDO
MAVHPPHAVCAWTAAPGTHSLCLCCASLVKYSLPPKIYKGSGIEAIFRTASELSRSKWLNQCFMGAPTLRVCCSTPTDWQE